MSFVSASHMAITILNATDNNQKIENIVFGTPVWMIQGIIIIKVHNNYMLSENTDKFAIRNLWPFFSYNMDFSFLFPSPQLLF